MLSFITTNLHKESAKTYRSNFWKIFSIRFRELLSKKKRREGNITKWFKLCPRLSTLKTNVLDTSQLFYFTKTTSTPSVRCWKGRERKKLHVLDTSQLLYFTKTTSTPSVRCWKGRERKKLHQAKSEILTGIRGGNACVQGRYCFPYFAL